jgi:probable HAF family extracellular repeat protein
VRLRYLPLAVVACLGAAILNGAPVSGRASRAYLVEDIGTIDGSTYVDAFDINERGDIAGSYQTPSGDTHAFRYTDATGMQDLGGASFGPFSQAFGINNGGDVVGVFFDQSFNGHGFLAPAGQGMQDLLTENRLITAAFSIQDDGRLTGEFLTPNFEAHPFRTLSSGEIQDLGAPGMRGAARRMSFSGQVTGELAPMTWPSSGIYSAFRFSDAAGSVLLGTFGGSTSFGMDINASNVIVGCAALGDVVSHAYRARESMPPEDLGTLGGSSSCAEGINDAGEIVGWADLANAQGHAFVYTDQEGMIDLDAAVPASLGLRLVFARAINNRGQIVAVSNTLAGVRTYRLTPVERDTVPPVITAASASPAMLWPPNGQSVPVSITAAATDNVDPAPVCRVTQVSVFENGAPLPGAQGDAQITGALTLTVRARRRGGAERTYSIGTGCSDSSGNTATTTMTVTVPRQAPGS